MLCVLNRSVVSDSLWPHELQPARLLRPWGFFRQEYWSGLPRPPPGDPPNPGIELRSATLQADSLLSELVSFKNGTQRLAKQALHFGYLHARHHLQKSVDSQRRWKLTADGPVKLLNCQKKKDDPCLGSPDLSKGRGSASHFAVLLSVIKEEIVANMQVNLPKI